MKLEILILLERIFFFIMKVTFLAIILPAMVFGQDVLWSDDKSTNAFNCDGFVTDAICCQDDLCNGQDENSCNSDPKTSLFCKWDRFSSKCLAFKDVENNVCCQSKPLADCSDLTCYHVCIYHIFRSHSFL